MEYYVLTPSADAWPRLVAARDEIGQVLSGIEGGVVHRSSTNVDVGAAATSTGSGQNANTFPPPLSGGMMPDSSAIQSMLRDPNMLRNVMGMMNVSYSSEEIKCITQDCHNVIKPVPS